MTALLAPLTFAVQLAHLENGMTVIVERDASAHSACVRLSFRPDADSTFELGAIELFSFSLLQEADPLDLQTLRQFAFLAGGKIEPGYDDGCVWLQAELPAQNLDAALTLFSRAIRKEEISPATCELAYNAYWRRINETSELPLVQPLRDYENRLGIGPANIAPMKADLFSLLRKKLLTPSRCVLAIVGSVDETAAMKRAAELFGRWNPSPASSNRVPKAARSVRGAPVGAVVASIPGPPPDSEQFPAWLVAFNAVGKGKMCAIFRELRLKRGAMYTWESRIKFCKGTTAVFAIPTLTPTEEIADAAREAISSAAKLSDEQLQTAKMIAISDYETSPEPPGGCTPFSQGHDSPTSKAFWYCFWQQYTSSPASDAKFLEKLKAVTPEESRRVWSTFVPRLKVERFLAEPAEAARRPSTAG